MSDRRGQGRHWVDVEQTRARVAKRHIQQGFTLLEMLVAFTIMALSLTLVYRVMGANARQAGDLVQRQEALLLAQSLLTQRDSVSPEGWNEAGTRARFSWVISSQVQDRLQPELPPLHEVSIYISWVDSGRQLQQNLRVLLPEQAPLPGARQP